MGGGVVRARVKIVRVGVAVFVHKQMKWTLSLPTSPSSLLFFRERTPASDHFPQNICALSPFLFAGGLPLFAPNCCISRCIGLFLSLSLFLSLPLLPLCSTSEHNSGFGCLFPQPNCALSPRSSTQGATVQRALRRPLHALQVPSIGCFDVTSLLCPYLFHVLPRGVLWGPLLPYTAC